MKPEETCQGGGPVSTLRSLTGLGSNIISHEAHRYGGPPTRRYARLIAVKATILHSRFVFNMEYLGYVWLPVQLSSQTAHNIANTHSTHMHESCFWPVYFVFFHGFFFEFMRKYSPHLICPCFGHAHVCVLVCACLCKWSVCS